METEWSRERRFGPGEPCFIVAEIGQNHNGDVSIARQLVDMAASSGADAVKFQKREIGHDLTKDEYDRPYPGPNSFGQTYGEHREFLELTEGQHSDLKAYAEDLGILYFCTACDIPSVEAMERIGNPIYKVASRDLTNIPLINSIAQTNKPIILSTGMATIEDVWDTLNVIPDYRSRTVILQCISEYPAQIANVNLRAMSAMGSEFGLPVGLSDHTPEFITSVAAAVLGAPVVEKHVTLSRSMRGSDHAGALESAGLKSMVEYIRICEEAMGDGIKIYNRAADKARLKLARSLVMRRSLKTGEVLSKADLMLKSPGSGLRWHDFSLVTGKRAIRDISQDTLVREEDFE